MHSARLIFAAALLSASSALAAAPCPMLPPPPDFDGEDEEIGHLPPEIEVQLSQLAAVAAGRLLQKDQAEAQQQQAQQQELKANH